MNIFDLPEMVINYFYPETRKVPTDPTLYTPLITQDAYRDRGYRKPIMPAVEEVQYEDNRNVARAFKDLTDAENELKNLEAEKLKLATMAVTEQKDIGGELARLDHQLEIAQRKYKDAEVSYRYWQRNNIDIMIALKEWEAIKIERDALDTELAPLWNAAFEKPKLVPEDFDLLEKLMVRVAPINEKYYLARETLRDVTLNTENEIHNLENKLKNLTAENKGIQVESIIKEPLVVGKHHLFNNVTIDEARELSLRLKTAQERYSEAKAQLAVINSHQQFTPGLQTNVATPARITPLEAVFQFLQYGKDLLSDAEVKLLIVDGITKLTTAAIVGKIGFLSYHSATVHILEAPEQIYTNSTGYNF